jgi:hypothetical protein
MFTGSFFWVFFAQKMKFQYAINRFYVSFTGGERSSLRYHGISGKTLRI